MEELLVCWLQLTAQISEQSEMYFKDMILTVRFKNMKQIICLKGAND